MTDTYKITPKRLKDLNGFGPRAEEILSEVGITIVKAFMAIDPYELYAMIKPMKGIGLD